MSPQGWGFIWHRPRGHQELQQEYGLLRPRGRRQSGGQHSHRVQAPAHGRSGGHRDLHALQSWEVGQRSPRRSGWRGGKGEVEEESGYLPGAPGTWCAQEVGSQGDDRSG